MDEADDTYDDGNRYAKRLLDRSQHSDCHSHSYRRRLSVMEALSKSPVTPSSDQRYDGNPFEKEFSGANKAAASSGTSAAAGDDQLEMTYVSTWPEDNDDLSARTFDVEPRDSLFCVESSLGDGNRSSLSSSRQFCRDIDDGDGESIAALTNPEHGTTLSLGERFGPLTSKELSMQSTLNLKYEREFAQCSARMQLQGPDEFFGARVVEICEPRIIKFHRKSCDSKAVDSQTRESELTYVVKEESLDTNEFWLETNLDGPPNFPPPSIPTEICASDATYVKENKGAGSKKTGSMPDPATASLSSEDMRDLDREIDKLQIECGDNKTAPEGRKISGRFEIVGAKNTVDGEDDCGRNYVMTTGRPINRSIMENYNGSRNPTSPKDATFSQSPDNGRQPNLSKTASFLKRHTSFLFKNLRTPKLVRRKSSVESTKKTVGSPWSKVDASALTRSNTMGSSDNERPTTQFQRQLKQVQADLPPDMDDTMMSEMENFLKVALGSGQYNSTMAQTNFDSRDCTYSVLSNNATLSESRNNKSTMKTKGELTKHAGTPLNRTMSFYKTLTQKIRDKFRKYDHTDGSLDVSNLDQRKALPEGMDPKLRETIKQLWDKVNIQNTMIHQTSKALQLCDSMPEFTASSERVEYERLLLLAVLTKNVVLREIDRMIDQKVKKKNEEYTYTERGEVTLKDIRLQLREDVIRRERQNGDVVEWFVVLVVQGATVWATHAIACPIASPQIYFPGVHTIAGLTPNFRLSIKVYSMKLRQLQLFNHEDKYHITRSCTFGTGGSKIKTPKMLRRKSVSPKQLKVKYNGVKETSFVFCGGVELMLYDLKLPSPWPLNSLASNSVLHGTIDLNFSCKLELSMFHVGFLTHCEETGDLAWNRRWCLLEGHKLMFWNYPREQEYKPPIYVIDLVNCASASVEVVDRRLCPRPRTLLLETKRRERELIVVEGGYDRSVTRHLLSYDNNNELTEWHSKLNHVISALSDWSVIQTQ